MASLALECCTYYYALLLLAFASVCLLCFLPQSALGLLCFLCLVFFDCFQFSRRNHANTFVASFKVIKSSFGVVVCAVAAAVVGVLILLMLLLLLTYVCGQCCC